MSFVWDTYASIDMSVTIVIYAVTDFFCVIAVWPAIAKFIERESLDAGAVLRNSLTYGSSFFVAS